MKLCEREIHLHSMIQLNILYKKEYNTARMEYRFLDYITTHNP
jgi:hypothetical protein